MLMEQQHQVEGGEAGFPLQEFTAVQTDTEVVGPAGATSVTIICVGSGGDGSLDNNAGGGGGACSRTVTYSLAGVTSLFLTVAQRGVGQGAGSGVRINSAGGTVICYAESGTNGTSSSSGGRSSQGVGDFKYSGGNSSGGDANRGGGGAAGPTANGSNTFNTGGGASGGAPGGKGGGGGSNGNAYGGGGGKGAQGYRGYVSLQFE